MLTNRFQTPVMDTLGSPFKLAVERERRGDLVVLRPFGELDVSTAGELAVAIERDSAGARELVIDLGGLTFIDCAGLRVFLYARGLANRNRFRLSLIRSSEGVQRLFRLTGLEDRLPFTGSPPGTNDAPYPAGSNGADRGRNGDGDERGAAADGGSSFLSP